MLYFRNVLSSKRIHIFSFIYKTDATISDKFASYESE